ncbi:unnamed protein product [Peniophora sp. CBMAI 1063]|nr:unnamed protein product [Peniophora sp. CBMAI 1063]
MRCGLVGSRILPHHRHKGCVVGADLQRIMTSFHVKGGKVFHVWSELPPLLGCGGWPKNMVHIQAPKYGAFPAQKDTRASNVVRSSSAKAMRLVLFYLQRVIDGLPEDDTDAYQRLMNEPANKRLQPLAAFLYARAHDDLAVGLELQARGKPRNHPVVHSFYHTSAGFLQLHFLILQNLRSFMAALVEDYIILEGNRFLAEDFYKDFGIPE